MRFLPFLLAMALSPISIASAQTTADRTPPGTYFVYGEEDGAAFVTYDPALAAADEYPLAFFYFREAGAFTSGLHATGEAHCEEPWVVVTPNQLIDEGGNIIEITNEEPPDPMLFEPESGPAPAAIVGFACHGANERLAQASAPIFSSPRLTAERYVALRRLGIGDRLARDLAIRDPATSTALIATAVPVEQRESVRAILNGG